MSKKEVDKHDLSKQPLISFSNSMTDIEKVEIKCTVENLLDSQWLFAHTPWLNHHGKMAVYKVDEESTIYYYDKQNNEIKSVVFDVVEVSAMHGFAGNSYIFTFFLNNKQVVQIDSFLMSLTESDARDRVGKYLDKQIEREKQEGKDLTDKYNKIILPKVKRRFS